MKIAERTRALKVADLIAPTIAAAIADGPLAGTHAIRSAVASHALALAAVSMKTGLTAPVLAKQVEDLFDGDLTARLALLIDHLESDRPGIVNLLPGTAIEIGDRGIMTVGALDGSGSLRTGGEIFMASRTQATIVSLSVQDERRCTPETLERYIDAVVDRCMASPAATGYTANALKQIMRQRSYSHGISMRLRFPLATPSAGQYDMICLDALQMEHSHPHELLGCIDGLIDQAEKLIARGIAMLRTTQPLIAQMNSALMEAGLEARVVAGPPRGSVLPLLLEGYGPTLMRERQQMFEVNGDQTRWERLVSRLTKEFMPPQVARAKLCAVLRSRSEENVDLACWEVDAPLLGMIDEMGIDRESFLRAMVIKQSGSLSPDMRRRFDLGDRYRDMTFTAHEGRISCSIQISPDINWNRNVLVIRNARIPATLLIALRKQPLDSLVAHPLLPPGILILSIATATGKKGETYTVSMRGMTQPAARPALDKAA